jgi:Flp pilus assembly protein TadG
VSNLNPGASRRRSDRGRGQALVEFALVIPLFLLLVAGMIDFGLGLNTSITVTNAAREGARLGAVNPITASIAAKVTSMTSGLAGGPTTTITCTKPGGTTCTLDTTPATMAVAGDTVIVTVAYDYHMIWPLAFGNTIHLASTAQFRVE